MMSSKKISMANLQRCLTTDQFSGKCAICLSFPKLLQGHSLPDRNVIKYIKCYVSN